MSPLFYKHIHVFHLASLLLLKSRVSLQEAEAIAPYSTFMRRDSVLYSTVGPHNCLHNSNQSNTSTTEDTRPEALL